MFGLPTTAQEELDRLNTPEELLGWMDPIEYGWMDKNYRRYTSITEHFDNDYRLLLPDEVAQHLIGVCWDQTLFEASRFKSMGIPYKLLYIQQYGAGNTHTLLTFQRNGKWWWFEHSYGRYAGIHGPFKSYTATAIEVHERMSSENADVGWQWTIMDESKFQTKLTCHEFMKACGHIFNMRADKKK